MHLIKAKSRNAGLITLFVVSSLVLFTASPAMAAKTISGEGSGTGWEYPQGNFDPDPCVEPVDELNPSPSPGTVEGDRFILLHTGTFEAYDTDVEGTTEDDLSAVFVGETEVIIDVGSHVISPEGVGPSCATPIGPVPVKNATVDEEGPTVLPAFEEALPPLSGNVQCGMIPDPGNATQPLNTYQRRSGELVTFTLHLDCKVQGNVDPFTDTVQKIETFMTIEGEMTPCFPPDPTGSETEDPVCVAGKLVNEPRNDQYGAHLVTTYQATGVQQQ